VRIILSENDQLSFFINFTPLDLDRAHFNLIF